MNPGHLYIQVAEMLAADGVAEREFGAFATVADSHPKLVLSLDKLDYSHDSIRHRNIVEWLLD